MFHSARIKLTAWYLVIIMAVSLSFSIVIFNLVTREVDRFERAQRFRIQLQLEQQGDGELNPLFRPQALFMTPTLIEETRTRLLLSLAAINGIIVVIAGGLGYVLAGRTLGPIQHMHEKQSRFVSDASHELKTPITSIRTSLEVYMRNKKRTLSDADLIMDANLQEIDRLQNLIESLIQTAQYDNSNGAMQFEKLSLAKVVKKSIDTITPLARKKNITVTHSLKDMPVRGNKDSLIDLFLILLDNAVKYSQSASTVKVEMKEEKSSARIMVSDSGIGMSAEEMKHVFDRFYQTDQARSKNGTGGFGLGLSIAKQIVTLHDGTIQARSEPGKGSVFTITLPLITETLID
jgi:two-component system, OmpR family, sensor histidine kinase CiaH